MKMLTGGERHGRIRRAVLYLLFGLLLWAASAGRASAAPAEIEEFSLPAQQLYPGDLVFARDGTPWLAADRNLGSDATGEHFFEGVVDRLSPGGDVSVLPSGRAWIGGLAAGSDGNVWFLTEREVGYLAPSGQFVEVTALQPGGSGEGITSGPDGSVWVTERNDSHTDAVVRIAPTGAATWFPLPHRESGPGQITSGPDGALWFTEYFTRRISRLTTGGEISHFHQAGWWAGGIVAGPDGNVWFTGLEGLERLTPAGRLTSFRLGKKQEPTGSISAGPDGRIWFGDRAGIGRISPSGRVSQIKLPSARRRVVSLATAPDGSVWYAAGDAASCGGGGLTCRSWIPPSNGSYGRVVPGALTVALPAQRPRATRRRAPIRLRCREGLADETCRGELRVEGVTATAGRTPLRPLRYRLSTDSSRAFFVPLARRVRTALAAGRRQRLRVEVTLDGGEPTSRVITVLPPRSSPHP
jgi:virginiamycin B lyase